MLVRAEYCNTEPYIVDHKWHNKDLHKFNQNIILTSRHEPYNVLSYYSSGRYIRYYWRLL